VSLLKLAVFGSVLARDLRPWFWVIRWTVARDIWVGDLAAGGIEGVIMDMSIKF